MNNLDAADDFNAFTRELLERLLELNGLDAATKAANEETQALVERVFYCNDIIGNVVKFLGLREVLNVMALNRTTRENQLILHTTRMRINKIFNIPTGFYLSGSTLLNALMNTSADIETDVDIYTNTVSPEMCEKLMVSRGLKPHSMKSVYFGNCVWIKGVQTFTSELLKVDVIYVSEEVSVLKMIHQNFDFSCVKNIFYTDSAGVSNLYIKNTLATSLKTAVLENYKNTYYMRLLKYLTRGYKIVGNANDGYSLKKSLDMIQRKTGIAHTVLGVREHEMTKVGKRVYSISVELVNHGNNKKIQVRVPDFQIYSWYYRVY